VPSPIMQNQRQGLTIDDFRSELINQAKILARTETGFSDQAFAKLAGERLVAAEELGSFEPCHVRHSGVKNVRLKLDGYEWDEDDDSFRLILAKYDGSGDAPTITKTTVESEFKAARAFVEHAVSGWCKSNLEPASEGFRLAEAIRHYSERGNVARYRIFLVSDCMLSERVKDWPEGTVAGVPVDYRIWDVNRFFEVERSALGREAIEVDLTSHPGGGVPVLAVDTDSADYQGYLCYIAGESLADVYDRYGSRLLEGNVRAFLSARGKVNKGIQTTITKQPKMFFAFNNGIAATASAVECVQGPSGGMIIVRATNLQIVNGGQTTASLSFARRKASASLEGICVAMKLSVVSASEAEQITPLISRFANSQNKVSDADLWSNHPFHRRIEELSRRLLAPAAGGRQYQTRWYYERARGQYQSDAGRHGTASAKRAFEEQHPKEQLISKELLAKVQNCWFQQPNVVSMGGQKNFLRFAQRVLAEWDKDESQFNEIYFRRMVGKLLIHRAAEFSAVEANVENRAIKAHIANYSLASVARLLEKSGRDAPWDQIWRDQAVPDDWLQLIRVIIGEVVPIMTKTDSEAMILTEWFKKDALWERVRSRINLLEIPRSTRTVSASESKAEEAAGKKDQGVGKSLDDMLAVLSIGSAGWVELDTWLSRSRDNRVVGPTDRSLVERYAVRKSPPSELDAQRLIEILKLCLMRGFEPRSMALSTTLKELGLLR
jgi:hypothetical protein